MLGENSELENEEFRHTRGEKTRGATATGRQSKCEWVFVAGNDDKDEEENAETETKNEELQDNIATSPHHQITRGTTKGRKRKKGFRPIFIYIVPARLLKMRQKAMRLG